MTDDTRLRVAIAKQEASNLMAAVWDQIDGPERARIGTIIALLGVALKETDQPVASVTQVVMGFGQEAGDALRVGG